ncbi:MAG: endolytic transglycosylase MltG [Rhodospirillales bacterium]|nr:endolytic transglycosylase MltG [Rhodospirillales bacterium]
MRRALLWPLTGLAVLVGLAVVLAIAGWLYVHGQFDTPGPAREERTVVLPQGLSAFDIADTLEDAGVIDDPLLFVAGLWIEDKQHALKAGEYVFEALVTPRGVMEKLVAGDTVVHRLTVTEGMTSAEIVAALKTTSRLEGGIETVPPEGSLLPETYHYALGDSRAGLVKRMRDDMTQLVKELWQARDPTLALDDAQQAVVLASVVEKETGVADERSVIAGVFLNRLRENMRLQSDPTVIYALTGGKGPLGRALTRSDLRIESPYNTYRVHGLPPGPIANPGRAALTAVLHPAATDALYFVADGSGGHAFAKTLDEHNRNVAHWRATRAKAKK